MSIKQLKGVTRAYRLLQQRVLFPKYLYTYFVIRYLSVSQRHVIELQDNPSVRFPYPSSIHFPSLILRTSPCPCHFCDFPLNLIKVISKGYVVVQYPQSHKHRAICLW